jgi:hypothetical protein
VLRPDEPPARRLPPREGEVRDSAGGAHLFDVEALFEAFEAVKESHAATEKDRHQREVHVVDEVSRQELSASAGLASMKWKVVPPSISIDGRG